MKWLICLLCISIISFSCEHKKDSVEGYLKSGHYKEFKKIGDTIILMENNNGDFISFQYTYGSNEFLLLEKKKYESYINNYYLSNNILDYRRGMILYTVNCASCHNSFFKEKKLNDSIMKIKFHARSFPKTILLGPKEFFKIDKTKNHSFYFLLPKKVRYTLMYFINNVQDTILK